MPLKTRRLLLALSVATFFVLAPFILLYSAGYRLATDWSISKTGGLYVHSLVSGSEIFLDGELKKQTNILQPGFFLSGLRPATYQILVAKNGYLSWQKKLTVEPELVTEAHAFLVPLTPEGRVLLRGRFFTIHASAAGDILMMFEENNSEKPPVFYLPDSEEFLSAASMEAGRIIGLIKSADPVYQDVAALYLTTSGKKIIKLEFTAERGTVDATYTKEIPQKLLEDAESLGAAAELIKYDPRGRVRVYALGNVIFAEWLNLESLPPYFIQTKQDRVVAARERIRSLDFYPGRRDLLIYSEGVGVYVVEIDGRGGRNIQPLYKGRSPISVVSPDKKMLYVLDSGILMEIKLP